jgi:metal-responsive CopG/Arc/MetJ family transcriptional regulator
MSSALTDQTDERVDWRYESRSQWVREAVQYRHALEDALDEHGIELPEAHEDREAYIREITEAGVAAVGAPETDDEA